VELRVQIESAYLRTLTEPEGAAQELVDLALGAIPELEVFGDDRSLGRAWMYVGWVRGGIRCQYRSGEEAAERALFHYRRGGWPIATPIGEIATALYFGPTPVPEAIARCDQLLAEAGGRDAGAAILAYLGGLEAQQGNFERARELVGSAQSSFEDLGLFTATLNTCAALRGDIEVLAGNEAAAESALRDLCRSLEDIEDWNHLSSRAADLADVLCGQRRYDEAEYWTNVSTCHSASDDLATQIRLQSALARIAAGRGSARTATDLARAAVRFAEQTDALNLRARALMTLAETVRTSDYAGASTLLSEAGRLYEAKGNTVAAARISQLSSAATPV
jgi:tetratricopeptide (TPR) repeat protein